MDEKKRVMYDADVMALPALRFVLGDIPSPDPDRRNKPNPQSIKTTREKKGTVKRIIAHLKED
jgi:hypothetical protein